MPKGGGVGDERVGLKDGEICRLPKATENQILMRGAEEWEPVDCVWGELGFPTAEALNAIAVTGEQLTTERTATITLPSGAVIQKASLIAIITAMNNTANTQKIDVTVQARKGGGAWNSYYSQDDCLGLTNSDAATTNLTAISDITALVTATGAYGFRCSINQSAANSVRYTTQYILIVVYV